jgi:hypothetical protein
VCGDCKSRRKSGAKGSRREVVEDGGDASRAGSLAVVVTEAEGEVVEVGEKGETEAEAEAEGVEAVFHTK